MPLLSIWKSNPGAVDEMKIDQILAIAGTGPLRDASNSSEDLREYLSQASSGKLAGYIEHCLSTVFNKGSI